MANSRARNDITWDGVVQAGRVLFGARADALLGDAAWRKELKRAYRRRALETHPDRARSVGRPEAELAREFRMVVEAYELLVAAPDLAPPEWPGAPPAPRRRTPPAARPAPPPAPAQGTRRRDARARRDAPKPPRGRATARPAPPAHPIPARAVRLGEFLYYSRRIPFEALVEAIAWQRAQRPSVGRIAVECGYLTQAQVLEVLAHRRRARALEVPFAEYATRLGLLTPFARLAVLARQGKLQRRIGRFFVERGWLTEDELAEARAEIARHNAGHVRT